MSKKETLNELLSRVSLKRNDSMHNINVALSNSDSTLNVLDILEEEIYNTVKYDNMITRINEYILYVHKSEKELDKKSKGKKESKKEK